MNSKVALTLLVLALMSAGGVTWHVSREGAYRGAAMLSTSEAPVRPTSPAPRVRASTLARAAEPVASSPREAVGRAIAVTPPVQMLKPASAEPKVELTPQHKLLLMEPTPEEMRAGAKSPHGLLESEIKDSTWAWEAEQALRSFLSDAGSTLQLEIVSVECRSSICVIQAFSQHPDTTSLWRKLFEHIDKPPIGHLFGQSLAVSSPPTEGRAACIAYMTRKKI